MNFKIDFLLIIVASLFVCLFLNYKTVAIQQYKADVVMFGDSITKRGNWSELLPGINVVNLGVDGDTAYNLKKRIGQVYKYNPKYCIILVGFNDIDRSKDDVNFIYKNYIYILEKLVQRDITPIIMSTTYAVADFKEVNTKIGELNTMLKKYAKKNEVCFIDLNKYFSKNHSLSPEFAADHVHLNKKAYKIWADELKKVIYKKSNQAL